MKNVLVDSSVWIDYFKDAKNSSDLDELISQNLLVVNELILAELTPFLKLKNQTKLIRLLNQVKLAPLNIDWVQISDIQVKCLKNGSNGVGIPDLIIAQNAKQHELQIFSLDKHFKFINQVYKVRLYEPVG